MSGLDDVLNQIRAEFVDEAVDNLGLIEEILEKIRSGEEPGPSGIKKMLRPAHSLKGAAAVADFPLVAVLIHRMEDYLTSISDLTEDDYPNLEIYISKAREFSNSDFDQKSINQADLVRMLPKATKKEPASQTTKPPIHEALMVVREKTVGQIFQRELEKFDLHVSTARSSYDAISMAVRTRPDIIFLSGVIDELSGADVASALHAMRPTKDIRICLITSFERDHPELSGLPEGVNLIRKAQFSEDLKLILQ